MASQNIGKRCENIVRMISMYNTENPPTQGLHNI